MDKTEFNDRDFSQVISRAKKILKKAIQAFQNFKVVKLSRKK